MECLPDPSALVAPGLAASANTGITGTNTGTTDPNTHMTAMTGITTQTIGIVIGAAGKATVTWMAGTVTLPRGIPITTTTGTTEGVYHSAGRACLVSPALETSDQSKLTRCSAGAPTPLFGAAAELGGH
jgi:hypothetical protein